jgi:hypothetical protein
MGPQQHIELELLGIMTENTPQEYLFGYYFPFKYFERLTGYDREIIRGFLRSMHGRGLVQYGMGFNEDGEVAGGGYTPVAATRRCLLA